MSVVGLVGSAIVVIALGEYEDIFTAAEGIFEDGRRSEVDIGIVAWGLIGGRTIEVPQTELTNIGDFLGHGLDSAVVESNIIIIFFPLRKSEGYTDRSLRTKTTVTIDPNI